MMQEKMCILLDFSTWFQSLYRDIIKYVIEGLSTTDVSYMAVI